MLFDDLIIHLTQCKLARDRELASGWLKELSKLLRDTARNWYLH